MKQFAIIFFLVLLDLGRFFQSNAFMRLLPVVLLGILIFHNYIYFHKTSQKSPIANILYLFIAVIIVGIIRNNNPQSKFISEAYKMVNFLLVIVAFFQIMNKKPINGIKDLSKLFIWTLYIPLLLLVLANILAYAAGLRSPYGEENMNLGDALFLSQLGISIVRVRFPFASGFNSYASIVGVLLLTSLIGYGIFRKYRKLMIFGSVISIITLLLADTRSAIIYPVLLFSFYFFFLKRVDKLRFLWGIPFITVFGSTIMLFILVLASQIPELAFLSRSSQDLETGNARTAIWAVASAEFASFKPMHLCGYGEYGHYESGASLIWSSIFVQWGDQAELTTPHSTFYSILFDYGYIGLIILITLQFKVLGIIKRLWKKYKQFCAILLLFLIYWSLIGLTETFFGFYTPNVLYIFIFVAAFIYYLNAIERNNINSNS